MARQEPLALATSRLHRCRSLEELRKVYLSTIPQFVEGDAYGMYLFDEKRETRAIFSHRANKHFLAEYENLRDDDPIFREVLKSKQFTHSLGLFDQGNWFRQPLYSFLSRWGLSYTIEAPLLHKGKVMGTLNIACGGSSYFAASSMSAARFLCSETNYVYQRLAAEEETANEIAVLASPVSGLQQLPARARQVLDLAVRGYNNRSIAAQLSISENTVRHHIKQLYQRFGVHNRVQLVQRVASGVSEYLPA